MSDAEFDPVYTALGFEQRMLARHEKRKQKLANSPVRETKVEEKHVERVEARGGIAAKWVSPGWAGVPDRIDLFGIAPMVVLLRHWSPGTPDSRLEEMARSLLAAGIKFTELKRPGKDAEPHQKRVHALLRKMGFTVNVIDHV
jgi:hypothetical protein